MQIAIMLNDVIREVKPLLDEFIHQKALSPEEIINSEEWYDYQNLSSPFPVVEEKINEWYDNGLKIRIICKNHPLTKKWLKNHYIPYDSIIETPTEEQNIEYWIDNNLVRCQHYAEMRNTKKVFYFSAEEIKTDKIQSIISWRNIEMPSKFC